MLGLGRIRSQVPSATPTTALPLLHISIYIQLGCLIRSRSLNEVSASQLSLKAQSILGMSVLLSSRIPIPRKMFRSTGLVQWEKFCLRLWSCTKKSRESDDDYEWYNDNPGDELENVELDFPRDNAVLVHGLYAAFYRLDIMLGWTFNMVPPYCCNMAVCRRNGTAHYRYSQYRIRIRANERRYHLRDLYPYNMKRDYFSPNLRFSDINIIKLKADLLKSPMCSQTDAIRTQLNWTNDRWLLKSNYFENSHMIAVFANSSLQVHCLATPMFTCTSRFVKSQLEPRLLFSLGRSLCHVNERCKYSCQATYGKKNCPHVPFSVFYIDLCTGWPCHL